MARRYQRAPSSERVTKYKLPPEPTRIPRQKPGMAYDERAINDSLFFGPRGKRRRRAKRGGYLTAPGPDHPKPTQWKGR